jgi:MoCo/4Fe-4S cofactor protein with predicted Tat translocation signal
MSEVHQCPSSHSGDSATPAGSAPAPSARDLTAVGTTGRAYWRGLDEAADTPEFREFLEKEFPAGASQLLAGSRRTFLKLMGAGIALAGAATLPGCRQPDHKILPYSRTVPELAIPGRPLFYATSMPLPGGGAEGLLIETHDGRPTKIEGNPQHPANLGRTSVWAQAAILSMYDPDRVKAVQRVSATGVETTSWGAFEQWLRPVTARLAERQGEGLAVVVERRTGVTWNDLRERFLAMFPRARWVPYDAVDQSRVVAASIVAFGDPAAARPVYRWDKADVILTLDRDFLQLEAGSVRAAREFASRRRVLEKPTASGGVSMTRLYAVESGFSITGAQADHRVRLAPSQIGAFLVEVARRVLSGRPAAGPLMAALNGVRTDGAGLDQRFVQAVAQDLSRHEGRALVVVGLSQPTWVHALAHAINGALGSIGEGRPVGFLPWTPDERTRGAEELARLAESMDQGQIDTIFVLDGNPCYDAPGDARFAERFAKVPNRVVLSNEDHETLEAATWRLPGATFLEAWDDTVSEEGTIAPVQPMIAPLFGGRSAIELLAMLMGQEQWEGYHLVRRAWQEAAARLGVTTDFETLWRRSLHDGLFAGQPPVRLQAPPVRMDAVAQAVAAASIQPPPTTEALDVVFSVGLMRDGRWNNNPWLQELPEPLSKVVWDNAAYMSPATARALGVMQTPETRKKPSGRMAEITVDGRTIRIVCWAVPGVADNTVVLPLGYGRSRVGLVGAGTGFDVNPLRGSTRLWTARGTLRPTPDAERYTISTTQHHHSMEGRALVRELDLQAWNNPAVHARAEEQARTRRDSYQRRYGAYMNHSLAEQLAGSEFQHMPAPRSIYLHPYDDEASGYSSARARRPQPGTAAFQVGPQWAMTIDLSTCIGCNVCTIACQAENNIPVVGKIEVQKGREMHWIRVDRYFTGQSMDDPEGALFQPVACVHCEKAPCETVCPVNATVHGPEGHNYMVYNRCIGTRYCANNCPWKVRRFNFFDYGVTKFNGSYFGRETLEGLIPDWAASSTRTPHRLNPNLIPPRLREKLDEISKMQKNPNVTVRSRGVMEKCTYCIQRTNEAKIELKLRAQARARLAQERLADPVPPAPWRPEDGLPDLFVQTACQQACPTGAITFGDMLDTRSHDGRGSLVRQMRDHPRSYLVLGYLGTRPRTSHLARVNNPNPDLVSDERRRTWDDPFTHKAPSLTQAPALHGPDRPPSTSPPISPASPADATAYVDPARAGRDGYVLSLGVLSSGSLA